MSRSALIKVIRLISAAAPELAALNGYALRHNPGCRIMPSDRTSIAWRLSCKATRGGIIRAPLEKRARRHPVDSGLIYSLGDTSKNVKAEIFHVEGDPDNPVNRGTLCPKGAGLVDMIHSKDRLLVPEVREAGAKEWKAISWDEALTRIAKHMKADRDANFQTTNSEGVTVNRWNTTGFLASSAVNNEAGYLTHKILRGLGVVTLDTQARI